MTGYILNNLVIASIMSWFLIGLFSGFICSLIDNQYKGFRFNWLDPFKMSFLGLIIFIFIPFLFVRSKQNKQLRNNRKCTY